MKDNVLNQSEIAKLANTSRENVKKVNNGIPIKDETVAKRINDLLQFDKLLLELFLDDDFYKMCDVAITKSRNAKIIKLAVNCQNASSTMRYKLEIDSELKSDKG